MRSRRLAVLTTGRQDYGILRSTLHALADSPDFDLRLWVGGMHLSERFGRPVTHIRADGLAIAAELPFLGDPPDAVSDTARAMAAVGEAIRLERPDALALVGDRSETVAAALGATLCATPLVHLHGGEESEGAIDNQLRHAITKLSHLHLVSHETHAARVRQMGEPPDHVHVVGAPGLDNAYRDDLPDRAALAAALGVPLEDPVVLVTMHPTTLAGDARDEVSAVAAAMATVRATYVITEPNADEGGEAIRRVWRDWAADRPRVRLVDALGDANYWGMLRVADAVLGNSSSGLIEAPQLGVPVVNVGDRQRGRLRGRGVIDVPAVRDAIATALTRALDPETRKRVATEPPPYPDGLAAPRILAALRAWPVPRPPRKAFRSL